MLTYLDPTRGEGKRQAQALLQYARLADSPDGDRKSHDLAMREDFPFPAFRRHLQQGMPYPQRLVRSDKWFVKHHLNHKDTIYAMWWMQCAIPCIQGQATAPLAYCIPLKPCVDFCLVLVSRWTTTFIRRCIRDLRDSQPYIHAPSGYYSFVSVIAFLEQELERRRVSQHMAASRVMDLVAEKAGGPDIAQLVASFLCPFRTYKFATPFPRNAVHRPVILACKNAIVSAARIESH